MGDSETGKDELQVLRTWAKESVPLGKSGDVIVFGSEGEVVVAGLGTILLSRDGGKTWSALSGGRGDTRITTDGGLTYDDRLSTDNGSAILTKNICGVENAILAPSGRLYLKTICEHTVQVWSVPLRDDTEAWHVIVFTYKNEPSEGVYSPSSEFVLAGDKVLIEASLPSGAAILTTQDDGASWSPFWRRSYFGPGLSTFDFIDADRGWLLLGNGELAQTLDGGRSWKTISTLPGEAIKGSYSLRFANTKTGFIVGFNGLILFTDDGGVTWYRQRSGVTFDLYKVAVADAKHVWAVGNSDVVLETYDGGANWHKVELGIDNSIYQRLSVMHNSAWVCSDTLIFHSADTNASAYLP